MDVKVGGLLGLLLRLAAENPDGTNLALSIASARRQVLLVDMDLRKPRFANCLGLKCDQGLLGVLDGRVS